MATVLEITISGFVPSAIASTKHVLMEQNNLMPAHM